MIIVGEISSDGFSFPANFFILLLFAWINLLNIAPILFEDYSFKFMMTRCKEKMLHIWKPMRAEVRRGEYRLNTHLTVKYLNRSATKFSVKTITTVIIEYNTLIGGQNRVSLFTNLVCLHCKSSFWSCSNMFSKKYANSIPPSLVQYILAVNIPRECNHYINFVAPSLFHIFFTVYFTQNLS